MEGRSKYPIPNAEVLKEHYEAAQILNKYAVKESIAKKMPELEGRMTVKETRSRYRRQELNVTDPFKDYITNLRQCAELSYHGKKCTTSEKAPEVTPMGVFGKFLKERVQANFVKKKLEQGVKELMLDIRSRRRKQESSEGSESEDSVERKKASIFRHQVDQDAKIINKISVDFLDKVEQNKQFKMAELGRVGKGLMQEDSP